MQSVNGANSSTGASKDSTKHTDTVSSILSSISLNNGDLNNTSAARFVEKPVIDPSYSFKVRFKTALCPIHRAIMSVVCV